MRYGIAALMMALGIVMALMASSASTGYADCDGGDCRDMVEPQPPLPLLPAPAPSPAAQAPVPIYEPRDTWKVD